MQLVGHVVYTTQAFMGLLLYDIALHIGFARAHALVRHCPVLRRRGGQDLTPRVCQAVAEASVWYLKRVQCLQRSAVTVCLLRLHGVSAELVIGFRPVPVRSHAWVEVDGAVVNDRPQYQKFFQALERL